MAEAPIKHQGAILGASPSPAPPVGIAAHLGWVSILNDCSSEFLARVLPLHLTLTLGASPAFVGVVEGLAECVAVLLKGLSGWLSDRLASRKGFVRGGYALSVAARACYLLVFSPALLGQSSVLHRAGKGLRAPRGMPWSPMPPPRAASDACASWCSHGESTP